MARTKQTARISIGTPAQRLQAAKRQAQEAATKVKKHSKNKSKSTTTTTTTGLHKKPKYSEMTLGRRAINRIQKNSWKTNTVRKAPMQRMVLNALNMYKTDVRMSHITHEGFRDLVDDFMNKILVSARRLSQETRTPTHSISARNLQSAFSRFTQSNPKFADFYEQFLEVRREAGLPRPFVYHNDTTESDARRDWYNDVLAERIKSGKVKRTEEKTKTGAKGPTKKKAEAEAVQVAAAVEEKKAEAVDTTAASVVEPNPIHEQDEKNEEEETEPVEAETAPEEMEVDDTVIPPTPEEPEVSAAAEEELDEAEIERLAEAAALADEAVAEQDEENVEP